MGGPEAFLKLSRYFFQDVDQVFSSEKDWVLFARKHLDKGEQAAAKVFVRQLLKGDDAELQKTWRSTEAEIGFANAGDLREFLKLAVELL